MTPLALGFALGVVWTVVCGVAFGAWLDRRTARQQMRAWHWDRRRAK